MGTTFLNAAWFASIELVDFRQHTIYFERYPMCRQATLARNLLDVVVVNDTPVPADCGDRVLLTIRYRQSYRRTVRDRGQLYR